MAPPTVNVTCAKKPTAPSSAFILTSAMDYNRTTHLTVTLSIKVLRTTVDNTFTPSTTILPNGVALRSAMFISHIIGSIIGLIFVIGLYHKMLYGL